MGGLVISNRFRLKIYDFLPNGYFTVPDKQSLDNSYEMLIMVTQMASEWHVLSCITKHMYDDLMKQIKNTGYYVKILIAKLAEDSSEYLPSWGEKHYRGENMFVPNHETWRLVVKEQEYINRLRYTELENKYNLLKSKSLKDSERKQVKNEAKQALAELKEVREKEKQKRKLNDSKPRSLEGYVYLLKVIGHDNLYKIGRTKNPDNRLRTFNVKLPFPVQYEHLIQSNDMYDLEAELHNRYHNQRQRNSEFFILSPQDIVDIKSIGTP